MKKKTLRQVRSSALCASLLASTSVYAQAVTTNWASWTLPSYTLSQTTQPNWGRITYAPGATGSVLDPRTSTTFQFTLSGEVASPSSAVSGDWVYVGNGSTPSATYLSPYVGVDPTNTAYITQTGFTDPQFKAHTLTFSAPVSDLVMAVRSLGSTGIPSSLKFSQPFQILSQNGLLSSSGDPTNGYILTGVEGAGVIQILGNYSSLSWTVTAPEIFSVFNIALTSNPVTGYAAPTAYNFPLNELPTPFGGSAPTPSVTPNMTTTTRNVFSSVNSTVTNIFDGGTLTNGANASTANDFSITSAGGTVDAAGNQLTFTGVISNDAPGTPGALTVASSVSGGSVVLQGVNTYTGATTIASGTTLTLSGAGSIASSSGVAVDGTFNISGVTGGASIKDLRGAGTVALGSQTLTLANAVNATPTDYFTGVLQGAGGLTVAAGSETLTGANTYTGATTIASGATLSIGAGGTTGTIGSGAVVNSGTLVLNRSNAYTFANALSGSGALTITGGGDVTVTSPTGALGVMTITGNTVAHFNTVALNNSSHAEIVALNANLSPNMLFSGSSLSVASGSTLRGAGFINAPTTVAGTLRPGNSPGTLVFGGSVTQAANSVLALDIDGQGTAAGAGNYSSVIVSGTGNTYTANGTVSPILQGITGSATNTYSPAVGSLFTVVSATGGVLGSFTGITQPVSGLLANTQFDSIYNANTFQLVITPSSLGGISGLTPNEEAVGGALQAVRPTPGVRKTGAQAAVYDLLYKLPLAGYAPAYDRISPAIYGDALMAQADAAGLMGSTVGDQMAQRRGASMGGNSNTQKYCLDGGKVAKNPDDCRQLTVWGAGIGQFGRTFRTLGDAGYKTDNRGLMFGADIEVENNARVGAFAGYAAGSADSSSTAAKADLSTYSAGLYGSLDRQTMYVNALVGYVSGDQKVTRHPLSVAASGKPNASGALFSLEIGARYAMQDVVFEPNVGLKATSLHRGAVNETGTSPLAATVSGDSVNTALASLGVRSIWSVKLANSSTMTVIGRAAYGHELGDQGTNVSAVFNALNTGVTVASSLRGRDAFLGGVTLAVSPSQGVDLFARYDAEVRSNANSQSISGGVKVAW